MRVAVYANSRVVNSNYRAFGPLMALGHRGHQVQLVVDDPRELYPLLPHIDALLMYRDHEEPFRRVLHAAREARVGIVWDIDDDVTDFPTDQKAGALRSQQLTRLVRATAELADVVTTTNERLAAIYRTRYGAERVRVIENYVPDEFTHVRPMPHAGVVVGWTMGGEHRYDFEQLGFRELLRRLIDAHPDVVVESLGVDLGLARDRYRYTPLVQFVDLGAKLAEWDVGIAPIVDMTFNQARSNVKLKEYGAAGLPWLASPIGPYADLGEKQGGRHVADDGWYEALDRLVRSPRDRRKLGKRAARWARGQTILGNVGEWERVLEEAVARARSGGADASPSLRARSRAG